MRASELLGAPVVDADGVELGPVRDVRVTESGGALTVAGLVVGGGPLAHLAHAWGFAEGRAQGPWLFRVLTGPASRDARFVSAARVAEWEPRVRLDCPAAELRALREEVGR